jgi:hypothetical protein
MKKVRWLAWALVAGGMLAWASMASAAALSIYDIQYTTDAAGVSPYNTQTVDCQGGIVINKFPGGKPKVTLYDPAHADGWGGLVIKDWTTSKSFYNTVQMGDWVSFTSTPVEEANGNSQLEFLSASSYNIVSRGNVLPTPLVLATADLATPIQQTNPAGWFVADHSSERYEGMYLRLQDVTVTAKDLGKASDNYMLQNAAGASWASDYMDPDTGGRLYHPLVQLNAHFESVSGICEQYTKSNATGNSWDYYQLLTTSTADFVVPEPVTGLLLGGAALLARARRRSY